MRLCWRPKSSVSKLGLLLRSVQAINLLYMGFRAMLY